VRWYLDHPEWVESVTSGSYRDWVDRQYGSAEPAARAA
jgi:dTDP-glucose 4,6-dehydratase